MADSKPAALQPAAAVPFVDPRERVRPHTKLIGLLALGGLGVAALGWIADHHGVPAALLVAALLPLAGLVAARVLPAPRDRDLAAT